MKNTANNKPIGYANLYPFTLYVANGNTNLSDYFDFYYTTTDQRNDEKIENFEPHRPGCYAVTFLVREKKTRNVGALIVLYDAQGSTLAHESIHYADAVYDYLRMNGEGYDSGNEQYAYLVTWCYEQLEDYLKCNKKRVRKTTE